MLDTTLLCIRLATEASGEQSKAFKQRQRIASTLCLVSRDFQIACTPLLFRHLHFDEQSKLLSFVERMGPPVSLSGLNGVIECVSPWLNVERHTTTITLAFRVESLILTPGSFRMESPLTTILTHTAKLETFANATGYLAVLPFALLSNLSHNARHTLRKLDGFALHAGCGTTEAFVEVLATFEKLEMLCTGPLWLPGRDGHEGSDVLSDLRKRPTISHPPFESLRELHFPLSAKNILFDALLASELPNLRKVIAAVWQGSRLVEFMVKHGSKLVELDIHVGPRDMRDSGEDREHRRSIPDAILGNCPHLTRLTLHDDNGLAAFGHPVGSSDGAVHASLAMIHLGTSDNDGAWNLPPYLEHPRSWPVSWAPLSLRTSDIVDRSDWKAKYPNLTEVTVYDTPRSSGRQHGRSGGRIDGQEGCEGLGAAWRNQDVSFTVLRMKDS